MGDKKHKKGGSTFGSDDQDSSLNSGLTGTGLQGTAMNMQSGMGNAAVQSMLQNQTWRESGNLRGNPPVRSEDSPPNIGIVEDQATYDQRYAAASAQWERQKTRADAMLSESGDPMDNRYWFAKVYSYVTENELQEAEGKTFFYPSYVLQCVRYFDKIYEDNALSLIHI